MSEQDLKEALQDAQEKLREQDEFLASIMSAPIQRGLVLQDVGEVFGQQRYLVLAAGGQMMEVGCDPKLSPKMGDTVRIHPKSGAIVDLVKTDTGFGKVLRVVRVVDPSHCMVDVSGEPRLVINKTTVAVGDQVLTDELPSVVLRNLGKQEQRFVVKVESVRWSDIGGLKEAKKQMIEAVEMPVKHSRIYEKYGKKPLKGVLLYGPPGCGKTMLGKAAATALANLHGASATQTGFMYVKGPEVLSKWVGETEATIRALFDRARDHKKRHGYPAIIFIDEAEALLGHRGGSDGTSRNWMSGTVVPTFLAEMDGLEESAAMVLLSTNHPTGLDTAIVREGRIDRKVHVTRPNKEDAEEIFRKHLEGKPTSCKKDKNELAKYAAEELFNPELKMYDLAFESGKTVSFTLGHTVSGAMIHGIIDQATSLAMMRDIETMNHKDAGLKEVDIKDAVRKIYVQNKDLEHRDDLKLLATQIGESVTDITKHVVTA